MQPENRIKRLWLARRLEEFPFLRQQYDYVQNLDMNSKELLYNYIENVPFQNLPHQLYVN